MDFRKQIDGLALIFQETLQLDPFSAHLFVFTNKVSDPKSGLLIDYSTRAKMCLLQLRAHQHDISHWKQGS